MDLQVLDPLQDPEWDALLLRSRDHSFFHTSAWARALALSYGFRPKYYVSLRDARIVFLMPLMEVRSVLTGKRGVALPFTDHCACFAPEKGSLEEAVRAVIADGRRNGWRYIEWREGGPFVGPAIPSEVFSSHEITLAKSEQEMFARLSDNNRRNIRKALRENVQIRIERSWDSLREFHRLNVLTRQRHGLPPQPLVFFENVFRHVFSKDMGVVVTATHGGRAIAASVFFHFGTSAIYKYGASCGEHLNLRPNNLVMWEALKWFGQRGFETLNLGRTEMDNPGLLQFKRTWGAKETLLNYYRYDLRRGDYVTAGSGRGRLATAVFSRTPTAVLRLIGRLFYKHVG